MRVIDSNWVGFFCHPFYQIRNLKIREVFSMANHQDDEDLELALKMSMQYNPPEAKRSKPIEETGSGSGESPEAKTRRLQREIMAAAAEKRMLSFPKSPRALASVADSCKGIGSGGGLELSPQESNQLFTMVFGNEVSKSILAQWTNQGIRYHGFIQNLILMHCCQHQTDHF